MGPRTDPANGNSIAIKQRTFLGHPIGLYVLFFTEMWERFSYYGMRGLLILYLINYFKMSQKDASTIYKVYTSLVYLTPLLGGYLADRYLGNKKAVIIGAILMAIGHFLMAFEPIVIFYSALVFLIMGNGFFKPNMSTQVGRLYTTNDPRRDGAYTIFYMGINLGAFLSPLACGWLAENTIGKYHSGFTLAGIGMVCGLLIYVFGTPWVREIAANTAPEGPKTAVDGAEKPKAASDVPSEAVLERTPSAMPVLNAGMPGLVLVLGCLMAVAAPVLLAIQAPVLFYDKKEGLVPIGSFLTEWVNLINMIYLEIAAFCFLISAWILTMVRSGVRDRVIAIYILGIFVVCFWAVFEQAGNSLNLWADKSTDRYLTQQAKAPALYPGIPKEEKKEEGAAPESGGLQRWIDMFKPIPTPKEDGDETKKDEGGLWGWWVKLWNPVATTWFQSINALAIFVLAPFFAFLWVWLDRRGLNPSIPTKMALGVLLMSLSFAVMMGASKFEDGATSVPVTKDQLAKIAVNDQNQLGQKDEKTDEFHWYHAGRLTFDEKTGVLNMTGVLTDIERDEIVRDTVPKEVVDKLNELKEKSNKAGNPPFKVDVVLDPPPSGINMDYAGFKESEVDWDPKTKTLTAKKKLAEKDVKALMVAMGDPKLRDTMDTLMVKSSQYRVNSAWLFWCYILATLGELCLSPVGLSMVSKLAPARFATMLMGLWLLTSFFGNFVAGMFGEFWGTVPPMQYFLYSVAALGVASLVLFVLVRKIVSIMHGVK